MRADRTVREPFERRKERPRTRGPAMRRESRSSINDRREARLAGRCGNRLAGDATPGQGSPSDARPTGRRARCDARLSARGEPGRCCAITLVERSCVSVALALVVQRTARLCWFFYIRSSLQSRYRLQPRCPPPHLFSDTYYWIARRLPCCHFRHHFPVQKIK